MTPRSWLRDGGTLAAVPLVVLGGRVLEDPAWGDPGRRELSGALLLAAGALLFGICAPEPEGAAPPLEVKGVSPEASPIRFDRWVLAWTTSAVALAAFAVARFLRSGEDLAVIAAWLLSIFCLFGAHATRGASVRAPAPGGETAFHRLLVAAILAVALAMRLHRLGDVPLDLDGDFAAWGLQARALFSGQGETLFRYGWAIIPMLAYAPAAATMALFGDDLRGLALSGVAASLLAILGAYLLARDLWNARTGVLAAALLTASYTFLHFGRTCAYMEAVAITTWAILLFARALRTGRGGAAVGAGIFLALGVDTYYAGRVALVIAPVLVLLLVARRRGWLRARVPALAFTALAFLATLGPMLVVFAQGKGGLTDRTEAVLVTDPNVVTHLESVYGVKGFPRVVLAQARRTALVFHAYRDTGTQFGARRPFLDPFSAAAVTLGLGWALARPRRLASQLPLVWLLALMVFGAILTVNAVFYPRVVALAVPASILGGIALERLYETVRARLEPAGAAIAAGVPALSLAALLAAVTLANARWYFATFSHDATPTARLGRWLAKRPGFRGLMVSEWGAGERSVEFLAPRALMADLDPAVLDAPAFVPRLPIVFSPATGARAERLLLRLKRGRIEPVEGNEPGKPAFYVYHPRG